MNGWLDVFKDHFTVLHPCLARSLYWSKVQLQPLSNRGILKASQKKCSPFAQHLPMIFSVCMQSDLTNSSVTNWRKKSNSRQGRSPCKHFSSHIPDTHNPISNSVSVFFPLSFSFQKAGTSFFLINLLSQPLQHKNTRNERLGMLFEM